MKKKITMQAIFTYGPMHNHVCRLGGIHREEASSKTIRHAPKSCQCKRHRVSNEVVIEVYSLLNLHWPKISVLGQLRFLDAPLPGRSTC